MRRWIVVILLLLTIYVLGWTITPRVDGRPVLLSPAVRGVLRYAGEGEKWVEALGEVEQLLLASLPSSGGDVALPSPEQARVHPDNLLVSTDRVRRAQKLAIDVVKEMDTTQPPVELEALHGEALELARGYVSLAGAVQEYLVVPTAEETVRIGVELANLSARRKALVRDYQVLTLRRDDE